MFKKRLQPYIKPLRIDIDQMIRMLEDGVRPAEIARQMGVGRAAVSKAMGKIDLKVHKGVVLGKSQRYADYRFSFIAQQNKDIAILNELLDRVIRYINGDKDAFKPMQRKTESKSIEGPQSGEGEGAGRKSKIEQKIETFDFSTDPRLIVVQIIREVREHLRLQLDTLNMLASAKNVMEFQKHVLDVIGQISPEAREKIVERLREEHAIRAALIVD